MKDAFAGLDKVPPIPRAPSDLSDGAANKQKLVQNAKSKANQGLSLGILSNISSH